MSEDFTIRVELDPEVKEALRMLKEQKLGELVETLQAEVQRQGRWLEVLTAPRHRDRAIRSGMGW